MLISHVSLISLVQLTQKMGLLLDLALEAKENFSRRPIATDTDQREAAMAAAAASDADEPTLELIEAFAERAAILEYDAGLPRPQAELAAWEQVQASIQRLSPLEWRARYDPERLPEGHRPEDFPIAQIPPGPQFWEERERRERQARWTRTS